MSEIDRLYEDELGYQAARASELESEVRRLRAELAERYEFTKALVAKYEALKSELAEEKAHGDRLDTEIEEMIGMVSEKKYPAHYKALVQAHAAHEARRKG